MSELIDALEVARDGIADAREAAAVGEYAHARNSLDDPIVVLRDVIADGRRAADGNGAGPKNQHGQLGDAALVPLAPPHLNVLGRTVWYADRLREAGVSFDPSLGIDDLSKLYRDTYDEPEPGPPAAVPTQPSAALERLSLRGLETYRIRQVEWLDKPFLQRAAFHLLAGRKGSGKGTHLSGVAARVSRGKLYPEPKRVLVITSEDSIELDFMPRYVAAGGDPPMVKIVNGPFRLPSDLPWLEEKAREIGNIGLIVIDPIGNHLGGADTDKEGLVREGIKGLNPRADVLDCMIVGVRHLGKDASRGALASVLGSTAWVDVPRAVILMAVDDEDETLVHAQVVAGNRGPRRNAGRVFRLALVDVPPATEITLLVAEGVSSKDVEHLLGARSEAAPASRSAEASELILDILEAEGEQESDALDARIARETGIAAKTVRNVRAKLSTAGLVGAHPVKDEYGTVTKWTVRRTLAPRGDDA